MLGTPVAEVVLGWLRFLADSYRDVFGFAGPPVHDACALALALDPSLGRCVEAFVAVETEGRSRAARPSSTSTAASASRRTRASRSSSTSSASGTS